MKDTIVEAVIEQLNSRSKIGIKKYGVTLDRTDLTTLEWIQHAQEEAMDLCLYLEKIKLELKPVNWYDEKLEDRINIIGQNGNDGENYAKEEIIYSKQQVNLLVNLLKQTTEYEVLQSFRDKVEQLKINYENNSN